MADGSKVEQLSSIVVAEQSGQMFVRPDSDFVPEGVILSDAYVSLVEHYIELQNTISYYSKANSLVGNLRRDYSDRQANLPHMHDKHRDNVSAQVRDYRERAKKSFMHAAIGSSVIDMFSRQDINKQRASDEEMLTDFRNKYFSASEPDAVRHKKTNDYRKELIAKVYDLQIVPRTLVNRSLGLKPHDPEDNFEIPELDTRQRLEAILGDPRAGFIPTTNKEKVTVINLFNYLDNAENPIGVKNQFLEVVRKSSKNKQKNKAIDIRRGPLSITYEIGDYLSNAIEQRETLEDLDRLLKECPNTRITVGEEDEEFLNSTHSGFAALIRYRDLLDFMKGGYKHLSEDPLLTRRDDLGGSGNDPGKHKTIEDQYTGKKTRTPQMIIDINIEAKSMTIGEARKLVGPAILDQRRRETFMMLLLNDIATVPMDSSGRRTLGDAIEAAKDILQDLIPAA